MTVSISTNVFQGTANGVFGELLQGMGTDNRSFLITAPMDVYSFGIFTFDPTIKGIQLEGQAKHKSFLLANAIYKKYQLEAMGGGLLSVETQFPVGKGLGSSSADLVAVAKTLSQAYNLNLSPEDIEDLIRDIEPTDGVMYPGVVSYYYKEVKLNKRLGGLSNAVFVGVDEGGEINTVKYNSKNRTYSEKEKQIYDQLHDEMEDAVKNNDISAIGRISTASGLLNQRHNQKKLLDPFLKIKDELSLSGIVVAHSGTYIGFLIDRMNINFNEQYERLISVISEMDYQPHTFNTLS